MDVIDEANDKVAAEVEQRLRDALAQPVPAGYPGVCLECGESSVRLVQGACAPCRDEFKLP